MKGAQIAQKERISIGLMHLPSFYSKDRSSEGRQHWDEYQLNSTQLIGTTEGRSERVVTLVSCLHFRSP